MLKCYGKNMKLPFVISIPHCSSRVPEEIRQSIILNDLELQESVDSGSREIFQSLPVEAVLSAQWSRLTIDLNRNPERRDKKGVIAQVDYYGRSIYNSGFILDEKEIKRRLAKYYWPFHNRLMKALERPHIKALFDCHSLNGIGPAEAPDVGEKRKDIILSNNGDKNGNSDGSRGKITCPSEYMHMMKKIFEKKGFSVSINDPYAGGFIMKHYGKKFAFNGKISIQVEINQNLCLAPSSKHLSKDRVNHIKNRVLQAFLEIAGKLDLAPDENTGQKYSFFQE